MSGVWIFDAPELPSPFVYGKPSSFRPPSPLLLPLAPSVAGFEELAFTLDLLNPSPPATPFDQCLFPPPLTPSPFDLFDTATDLIRIETTTPFSSSCFRRYQKRSSDASFYLRNLCERVSALELGFDRVLSERIGGGDRKYKWTAEIKAPEEKKKGVDRKYKWTAEIKAPEKKKDGVDRKYTWRAEFKGEGRVLEKSCKWTAELKGKGKDAPLSQTYSFSASTTPAGVADEGKKKGSDESKTSKPKPVVVEIEDTDRAAVALRQAFSRRAAVVSCRKGKRKELSPQDAALIIQVSYRAHLVRRSQLLRALRDLAVAKAKLKEIRASFSNFSYRQRITVDAEERQRFSEKIIVLLLTVDAIEGADHIVRAVRKSMLDELEAMLDVVEPHPPGKLGSMRRRKFDLPEGPISEELASGVPGIVQMIHEEVDVQGSG
ncbi:hypothetical protein ACLOJK_005502 [Asimina triloba]